MHHFTVESAEWFGVLARLSMRIVYLQKPSPALIGRFLEEQAALELTYAAVGATSTTPPAGFVVDRTRIELGSGEAIFDAAKAVLQRWQQFRLGWVDVWPRDTPLEVGKVVAVAGWAVGLWWLNACRIVYTVNETGSITQFGFAYGTLPGHVESGEERFLIEWNRDTGRVEYEILAFSKPNHFLTRVGYRVVRRCQKRFGRNSAATMFRAVNSQSAMPSVFQSTGPISGREGRVA